MTLAWETGQERACAKAAKRPMRLGMIISIGHDPESALAKVHELGLPTCQVYTDTFDSDLGARLAESLERYGIEATTLVSLGPGPQVWNFDQGPLTIGLVPREWRQRRIDSLKRASDFAKRVGIPALHTHCGFIPEDPNNPLYSETVEAIREVASHCQGNGQSFLYESGQETPVTLLRAILDVGLKNLGVNLDTANLILYDKGNPVDALDVVGTYVRGLHAKDGLYPTDPKNLGQQVPVGQGKVDFPRIIQRLKELHYQGAITIELEIPGPREGEYLRQAKEYLESLIG